MFRPEPAWTYRALVQRVIDGDTYVLVIDLGFAVAFTAHVRLRGASCPELSTPEGQRVREIVVDLIAGHEVIVRTQRVPVRSFARYVAQVFLADGTDLAELLIERNHAVAEP